MTSKSVCVCVSVIVAVLLTATAEESEGEVHFSGTDFSMTCPQNGTWFGKTAELSHSTMLKIPNNDRTKGLYYCEYSDPKEKYYFYVQGKVCENCMELTPVTMMAIICVDVVLTMLVILLTYRCSQRRSPAGAAFTPKAAAPPRGRGPAVPSPDYEALDQNTRSHGTYSKVNRQGL